MAGWGLTLGTTLENQGLGDKSSENHLAVAEPWSFARLCISQSILRVNTRPVIAKGEDETWRNTLKMYTGPRTVFRETLKSLPGILIPLCRLSSADRNTDIDILETEITFMISWGKPTAYNWHQPMATRIQYRSRRAYA